MRAPAALHVVAVEWPEIHAGDDLCRLLVDSVSLDDGDVVVLTSKVVSKAAGRVVRGDRGDWAAAETRRVVARRGETVIAQTRHGLVIAAAGVDASNVAAGRVVLLPDDADASARGLRECVRAATGRNVAVVVTDTAGRAWRVGQTDQAIGCAGIAPVNDLRGSLDGSGRRLDVTMPAVADELAAAGDLVKGKATGCPLAVVRGLADLVLPPGDSGPGAAALIRGADDDLFGLGAREAVAAAVLHKGSKALRCFPALGPSETVPFDGVTSDDERVEVSVLSTPAAVSEPRCWQVRVDVRQDAGPEHWLLAGRLVERTRALASAYRLTGSSGHGQVELRPGWQTADCTTWRVA